MLIKEKMYWLLLGQKVKQEQLMAEVGLNFLMKKKDYERTFRKVSPKIIFVACETLLAFYR